MGEHLVDGTFKSDKYPWCPAGFVALKLTDKDAQPFLWGYAESHRGRDRSFTEDLQAALRNVGFWESATNAIRDLEHLQRAWPEFFYGRLKMVLAGHATTAEDAVAYAEQLADLSIKICQEKYRAYEEKIVALKRAAP